MLTEISLKGLMRSSFVDWDGRVSAVFFMGGCNFRCPFCHNSELVLKPDEIPDLPPDDIEQFLKERQGWLDIVITGGEPTLNPRLGDFCRYLKELGFMVKLDTNGYRPEIIKDLVKNKLVDYVAMDIKASIEDYPAAVGIPNLDVGKIKTSVEFLLSGVVDCEFRSTVAGDFFSEAKMKSIAAMVSGVRKFRLQPFNPSKNILDPSAAERLSQISAPIETLAEILSETIPDVRIRGRQTPLPQSPFDPD